MSDLETMAEKADALAAKFREPASFELVRGALNEAGVVHARRALADALDGLEAAQTAKRTADTEERAAKEAHERALVNAEWEIVAPDKNEAGAKLLAADKAAWKKQEAAKHPEVVATRDALRQAEHRTAEARDAITTADKRLSATRADLDASIAILEALCLALPARKGGTT